MESQTLGGALELEHRQIDGGIEAYLESLKGVTEGPGDPAPLLAALQGLRRHIYLEEEFLFPPLRQAGLMMPVMVMVREHGGLWDAMDALEARLGAEADPAGLRQACAELLSLLDAHNSKEEPIIYTQADAILGAEAGTELLDFIEDGTTPEGWVAAAASR